VTVSALAIFLVACGGADAPPEEPTVPQMEIVPNYRVISDASEITIAATQQGDVFTGSFGEFDAQIDFDAGDLPGSKVMVRIPLSSLELGSADRNDAIPSKTWFNMRLHPIATFESDAITELGDGYQAEGYLTMKGLRRPVTLPFVLEQSGDQTVMRGQVEIDRTTWNLGEAPWDTEEWVGHTVTINVTVTAERI
ncbi:MAG: YceI family protein, partial [Pseudomonadota bacterium]